MSKHPRVVVETAYVGEAILTLAHELHTANLLRAAEIVKADPMVMFDDELRKRFYREAFMRLGLPTDKETK